nr:hypothetical protein [Enterococcus faecalis]
MSSLILQSALRKKERLIQNKKSNEIGQLLGQILMKNGVPKQSN